MKFFGILNPLLKSIFQVHSNQLVSQLLRHSDYLDFGNFSFSRCSDLQKCIFVGESIPLEKYGLDNMGLSKSRIGKRTFDGCSNLSEVILPERTSIIEDDAFSYCQSLKTIYLPRCLEKISRSAFYYCENLEQVKIPNINDPKKFVAQFPDNLKQIEKCAFYNCDFQKVVFGEKIEYIGDYAFKDNAFLNEILFNSNKKVTLGNAAFKNAQVTAIITQKDRKEWSIDFGEHSFEDLVNLISFPFPNIVSAFASYCFADCSNLKEIIEVCGVGEIGKFAFFNCSSISSVRIEGAVDILGDGCFKNCISLVSITLPSNLRVIRDESFENCSKLSVFDMPQCVNHIGYHAFMNCVSLPNFKINENTIFLSMGCLCGCTQLVNDNNIPKECFD
ncbi:hypothetical protein EIN_353880 [Entamoeba invadens IP1]|uniref:Leucine rich repeat containing protein BspA family protein n=1 Tax=Entamoeba invadens IP1 TaxID=370355 RepID=L7FJY3_ENTIV|nr:hypothetical protein EIN_353880 [Entamoeba invadens IP1]ELP84033.1 hypothetical protein EIN_353880 [Entamoeba invadens IP1]|eukprot:XP_004183379.1 hypothetical protein EIN_353880 [Entamoeba invadens IP1]